MPDGYVELMHQVDCIVHKLEVEKMDNKLIMGIFTVIGLIVGFGGNSFISGNVIDNTYVCSTNGNVGSFDSLSGSKVTGYYQDEYGAKRGKQCRTVGWTPIKDYAVNNGVSVDMLLEPKTDTKVIETLVQRTDCPITVIAYTDDGKYFCEGIGPGQKCETTNDILSELG